MADEIEEAATKAEPKVTDKTGEWTSDGAGGDLTEVVNPVLDYEQHCETEVGPTAWSHYQPEDRPVREGPSWKQVSLIAAAIFVPLAAVAVMLISSWVQQQSNPPLVSEPLKVVTVPPAAAPQAPAVVPPPVTVTAPPPVTVTQAAPPPVTVAAPPVAAPPTQGTFLVCPDGRSGIATSVTSCQFAMNVRDRSATFVEVDLSQKYFPEITFGLGADERLRIAPDQSLNGLTANWITR
jgi:hypothetical protein